MRKKLQDVDRDLIVDYVYSNLNSSGLESVKDDSGNLSASMTHMTLANRELRDKLASKGKGDMINIKSTSTLDALSTQDSHDA